MEPPPPGCNYSREAVFGGCWAEALGGRGCRKAAGLFRTHRSSLARPTPCPQEPGVSGEGALLLSCPLLQLPFLLLLYVAEERKGKWQPSPFSCSDVVVQIVDARNPLLFRCPDLVSGGTNEWMNLLVVLFLSPPPVPPRAGASSCSCSPHPHPLQFLALACRRLLP